jgi:hypothetical protein
MRSFGRSELVPRSAGTAVLQAIGRNTRAKGGWWLIPSLGSAQKVSRSRLVKISKIEGWKVLLETIARFRPSF